MLVAGRQYLAGNPEYLLGEASNCGLLDAYCLCPASIAVGPECSLWDNRKHLHASKIANAGRLHSF